MGRKIGRLGLRAIYRANGKESRPTSHLQAVDRQRQHSPNTVAVPLGHSIVTQTWNLGDVRLNSGISSGLYVYSVGIHCTGQEQGVWRCCWDIRSNEAELCLPRSHMPVLNNAQACLPAPLLVTISLCAAPAAASTRASGTKRCSSARHRHD